MRDQVVLALAVRRMDLGRARALRLLLPDFAWRKGWLQVPLRDESPEEVLAACCAVGLEVLESRVVRPLRPADSRATSSPRSGPSRGS